MDWYYVNGGSRNGPVGEEEFQRLVQQGVVNSETLVWRDGMANWETYGATTPVSTATPPSSHTPAGYETCVGCGKSFSRTDVIQLAGGLYCAGCKPLALQRLKEGVASSSQAESIRQAHITHEASVRSIGVLYYLGGSLVVLAGLVGLFAPDPTRSGTTDPALSKFVFVFILAFGICYIWVATGVRRLKKWARVPVGILSGLGLLGFPVGTVINGYILYLVFCKKGETVFSDDYKLVIEQTPHIKYRTSLIIWILLGFLLLLVLLGLLAAIFARR